MFQWTGKSSLSLRLNSNQLRELSATAFKGLDSLFQLDLGYNSISRLSSRTFEYLNRLRYISLYRLPLHCDCSLQWMSKVSITLYNSRCATPPQHSGKEATDASIYVNCTQELSYQCFNRSVRCPTGSYCQDTLYSYTCVCEEERHYCRSNHSTSVSAMIKLAIIQPQYLPLLTQLTVQFNIMQIALLLY